MRRIATVAYTNDVPDEVLAQAVAGAAGWLINDSGTVFGQDEVFVASSLAEAAAAMRNLEWFTPLASGVDRRRAEETVRNTFELSPEEVRAKDGWADVVRGRSPRPPLTAAWQTGGAMPRSPRRLVGQASVAGS